MALCFPYVLGKDEAVRANYICRPIGHLAVADYELYLVILLCMGAVILSALVCIWVILSTRA